MVVVTMATLLSNVTNIAMPAVVLQKRRKRFALGTFCNLLLIYVICSNK
jgi:hypothetical protein